MDGCRLRKYFNKHTGIYQMNVVLLGLSAHISKLTALALLANANNQVAIVASESEPYPYVYPTQSGKQKAQWKQETRGKKIK